jgi:SAM-dependent methyltransferase
VSGAIFDDVAARYARDSVAQQDAAGRLLALAGLRPGEAVLDVGCGTGHLLARLLGAGAGRVVGADPSPAMVAEARRAAPLAEVRVAAAEDLPFEGEFDAVVSNSAFQWFRDPARGLRRMRAALRPGGRLALQCPAGGAYCPAFIEAMREVAAHPDTAPGFAGWRPPWRFLETAAEYAALAVEAGLEVRSAAIEPQVLRTGGAGAFQVFSSAAAAGYLGDGQYAVPPGRAFRERALELVREVLSRREGPDGTFDLVIHRLWLTATAP